jgi:arsenic resistance protein ArsH
MNSVVATFARRQDRTLSALSRTCLSRPTSGQAIATMSTRTTIHGDLNNSEAMRRSEPIVVDPSWAGRSLAIPADQDDATVRARYRPFLLPEAIASNDWVAKLELSTATKMAAEDLARTGGDRLKVLVLYGSQRERSYSRLLAYEQARILFRLGCDVRVYDPTGLPIKDDVQHEHPKVQELRNLSKWSDGHLWVSPEQHGILVSLRALEAVMPSTISSFTDLLPSRRPPYSRTRSTGSH